MACDTTVGTTETSPTMLAIEDVATTISSLEVAIDHQETKLQPISTSPPPEGKCAVEDPGEPAIPLVGLLQELAARVKRARDRLEALTNRVAL